MEGVTEEGPGPGEREETKLGMVEASGEVWVARDSFRRWRRRRQMVVVGGGDCWRSETRGKRGRRRRRTVVGRHFWIPGFQGFCGENFCGSSFCFLGFFKKFGFI